MGQVVHAGKTNEEEEDYLMQLAWPKLPLQRRQLASLSLSSPRMWCTGDFFAKACCALWACIVKNASLKHQQEKKKPHNPQKRLVLLSEFGQFSPVKFGGSRGATWFHFYFLFIPGACSVAPQLDSHCHNQSLILWETLNNDQFPINLAFLLQFPLQLSRKSVLRIKQEVNWESSRVGSLAPFLSACTPFLD